MPRSPQCGEPDVEVTSSTTAYCSVARPPLNSARGNFNNTWAVEKCYFTAPVLLDTRNVGRSAFVVWSGKRLKNGVLQVCVATTVCNSLVMSRPPRVNTIMFTRPPLQGNTLFGHCCSSLIL